MHPVVPATAQSREVPVGKVLTSLNRADQIRAKDGTISPEEIRSVNLVGVLVDTGATTLCLPGHVIEALGLSLLKEVEVMTAMGVGKARIFEDAKLLICGREGTFECLELPGGSSPLLGMIPLEMLGLEPDLQRQTLRILPSESINTYLTIM